MLPKIKNIIFDIGRVIVGYQEQDVIAAVLPDSKHKQFYVENFFKSQIWQDLDRGIVTASDVIQHLSTFPNHPESVAADVKKITTTFVSQLPLLEGSQELFISLAKQYPIYILSNFQDEPFDQLLELHPFLKLAKGMVVSAKIKMMKPEVQIYSFLLNTFSLTANECLFLDDRAENIEVAKTKGLHGIVFENAAQARLALKDYNIQL